MTKKARRYLSLIGLVSLLMGNLVWTPGAIAAKDGAPQIADSGRAAPQAMDPKQLATQGPEEAAAAAAAAQDRPRRLPKDQRVLDDAKARPSGPQVNGAMVADTPGIDSSSKVEPSAQVLQTNASFDGINETNFIPPDNALAAGLNHVVHAVNSALVVKTKLGATVVGPVTLANWFAGCCSSSFIFDPIATYRGNGAQAAAGRYYVAAVFLNKAANPPESKLVLSVSQTTDPTGAWCNYTFDARFNGGTTWADFPGIGVTDRNLLISTNQFTFNTNSFTETTLFVLNKADLDACAQVGFTRWFNFLDANGGTSFNLRPAVDYDASGATAAYIVNNDFGSNNVVTVWRMNNPTPNGGAGSFVRFTVNTLGYSIPPDAPQPGTGTLVSTNDNRLLNATKRYGTLWTTNATGLAPAGCSFQSAVLWIGINAPNSTVAAPSLQQNNYNAYCNGAAYFPAITPDGWGNMMFTANFSNANVFPSVYYNGRMAVEPLNTLTGSGAGLFLIQGSGFEQGGRYGDYSAVSMDPADQRQVWIVGEYMPANNIWRTRIGKVFHRAPVV